MQIVDSLADAIREAKRGQQVMTKCQAHEDGMASLHVSPGQTQPVIMKCHAGCDTRDVLDAAGVDLEAILNERDESIPLNGPLNMWTPAGTASHVYPYCDEAGNLLFEVMRIPLPGGKKTFRQRRPDATQRSGYAFSLGDTRRVLYRLPEVIQGVRDGKRIWIVEGEKDVESIRKLGEVATTSPMGAGKWLDEFSEFLRGATVHIIADADATGRAHARSVREKLQAVDANVSLWEASHGKDVTDHLSAGLTLDLLIETAPEEDDRRENYGIDLIDAVNREFKEDEFVIPGTLARADRLLVTGFEGHGKAVSLDTKIMTPTGWTTMREVQPGDVVIASDGQPCNVVSKTEPFLPEVAYKLHFSDGSTQNADANHQWVTWTVEAREADARLRKSFAKTGNWYKPKHVADVATSQQIKDTLKVRGGVTNHAIKVACSPDLHHEDLPVEPYTLGVWLGDGDSSGGRLTLGARDFAITEGIHRDGYSITVPPSGDLETSKAIGVSGLSAKLREAGVLGDKHIPMQYLRGAVEQRLDLLAGICDSDGYVDVRGESFGRGGGNSMVEITFTNERLANDTMELVRSLGIIPRMYVGDATIDGRFISKKYRINFQSPFNPFRHASFKADRWRPLRTMRSQYRYITDVEEIEPELMACIQVDSRDSTYLVGESMIPTHNSTLLRQMAVQVAAGIHPWTLQNIPPQKVLVIDVENHPSQVIDSWQNLMGLCARMNRPIQRGQLTILEYWDNEIDLTGPDGQAWLNERIHAYKPDMALIGPLYNMSNKDLKDDETVRKIKKIVNEARGICGTAFVMEHHAPHKGPGDTKRSVRPYGSSTFLKWPDFGYGINPVEGQEGVYEWQKTRFPRVRSRIFPEYVRWGKPEAGEFPWMQCHEDAAGNFH